MKKRILFITHSSAAVGGAEDEFERLLKYFSSKKDDYEIHGLFPEGPRKLQYANYCNKWSIYWWGFLPVIYDKLTNYLKYSIKIFLQGYDFFKFTKNSKYDLCVLNVVVLLWPVIFCRLKDIKTIVFVRENIEPNWLRHFIYRVYKFCNCYFISNSKTKRDDIASVARTKRINFIYPGIEVESNSPEIDLLKLLSKEKYEKLIDKAKFKFINVGPVYERKNQMLVIEALNVIKNSGQELPYVFFVGDYDVSKKYCKTISQYIADNSLKDNCIFLGEIYRNSLSMVFNFINSLVMASVSEGMPISIVESMRYCKPVISTKVGGIPEIITNMENSILIDFDANDLASKMLKLMNDDELYNKLSSNAHSTYLEKFDINKSLKKTEDIFDFVINES